MRARFAIVEAPSILGLRPTGVERLPDALLAAGLDRRLGARRAGRVDPPAFVEEVDASGIRNVAGIVEHTTRLAAAVGAVLDAGEFPVVLGGDCSILLGNLLALRRRGRYGLLFLDGHADFYQPEANVEHEAASSELAFATGRGPEALTRFDRFRALVEDEDVVVFAHRDADDAAAYGSQPLPDAIHAIDLPRVRALGIEQAASQAVARLASPKLGGFWVHVDADVLDDAVMPAVDYRLPGGLAWRELEAVLRGAMRSGRAVGLDLTIFNPRLDPGGGLARALVETLSRALLGAASSPDSATRTDRP